MRRSAATLLLLAILLGPAAGAGTDRALLVVGPLDQAVLVEGGKITAVGTFAAGHVGGRSVGPGTETLCFPGAAVLPGFIDAGTLLAGDQAPDAAIAADVRAADGVDLFEKRARMLAAGVTAAAVDPGRSRLVTGLSAVIRLGGGEPATRMIRRECALHVVLSESGRNPPRVYDPPAAPAEGAAPLEPARPQLPSTLPGAVLRLREVFAAASGGGAPAPGEPAPLGLPVVARALAGEIPVFLHADREDEIRAALSIAAEHAGARFVLVGGGEAGGLAKEIAAAGLPVVLDAGFSPGAMPAGEAVAAVERRERALGAAAALEAAGVKLAFRSSGDPEDLPFLAARFVRGSFGYAQMVTALTANAAEILGVSDRIGRLVPGLDADLVVTVPGGPVEAVIAGGEVVYRRAPDEGTLLVAGDRVYADEGRVLADAGVLIAGGRILEVGPAGATAAREIRGPVVVPGFLDAHSHLGLLDPEGRGGVPAQTPLSVPMARILAPGGPAFAPVARAGIAVALLAPPGNGLVAGLASVARTAGRTREEMVIAEAAAVVFTLAGSRDLAATMEQVEGVLRQGKAYADAFDAYAAARREFDAWVAAGRPGDKREEPKEPGRDPNREPLRDLLAGRIPAIVRATAGPEVREALSLFGRFGVAPVLAGAEGATGLAEQIRAAGAAVLLGPRLVVPGPDGPVNLAAAYARAGVPVLFGSSGTTGGASLPDTVAHAVHRGLPPGAALAGMTWTAADRLGIGDRAGRLAPGRPADLVVLSGPPFAAGSRVLAVVVGGRVVFEEENR